MLACRQTARHPWVHGPAAPTSAAPGALAGCARAPLRVAASVAATLVVAFLCARPAAAVPPRVVVPQDANVFHASAVDAFLPNTPPYPVDGLIARHFGTFISGLPDVSLVSMDVNGYALAKADAERGYVAQFENKGRLRISLPVALVAKTTQMVDGKPQPFGLGVSLFYRFDQPPAQRVTGWMPLVSLGQLSQPWSLAVLLKSGVPVLARKNSDGTLFDLGAVAVGHQPTLRIDDGKWHHVVVNFIQEPNPNGCGGKSGAACAGRGWLRLHIDGVLTSEYLIDVGQDFRQLDLGSLAVTQGTYSGQANWQANPPTLLSRGLIDDLMAYRRPLTTAEMSRLVTRNRIGLVAQWPAFTPSLSGLTSAAIPGAPAAGQSSPTPGYKATSEPIFVAKKTPSSALMPGQLHESLDATGTSWTFAGVARSNGQKWLAQLHVSPGWVGIYASGNTLYAACGSGVPNWASDTATTAKVAVSYSTDATVWRRFAIIADGDKMQVLMDGQLTPLPCGPRSATFALHRVRATGTPASEPAADVARVLLFKRAVPVDELWATAFPGPIAWFDGTAAEGTSMSRRSKLSWSGLWLGKGGSSAQPPSDGIIGAKASASTTALVAAVGVLDPKIDGGAVRPFTVALRVKPIAGGTGMRDIPLMTRTVFGQPGIHDVDVRLVCDYGGSGCRVYMLTPGASPGAPSGQWRAERVLPWGQEATIVVSWPVTGLVASADPSKSTLDVSPRVAINGETQNQVASSGTQHVVNLLPVWKKYGNHLRPDPAGKFWVWLVGGDTGLDRLALLDVRIYPYAVQDVAAIGARCANLACGETGRLCAEADASNTGASGFCHGCDANHVAVAGYGYVERQCRPKAEFYGDCGQNADCQSGACDTSTLRCAATNATKEACTSFCSARGRTCAANAGGTWRCGECRGGYKRLPGYGVFSPTHPDLECTWNPTIEDGEPCSANEQCMSALCATQDRPKYKVYATEINIYDSSKPVQSDWWPVFKSVAVDPTAAKVKRCAIRDTTICSSKFLAHQAESAAVFTPDCALTPANACGVGKSCSPVPAYHCKDQCNTAYRERRWTVLSPQACNHVIADNLLLGANAQGPKAVVSHGLAMYQSVLTSMKRENFNLNDLRRAFLRESGNYNNNTDYGRLINAGVGRLLIAYAQANQTEKNAMKAQYGNFGRLADCATAAPYNNSAVNFVACEPKLQPIGAICPPPGESAAIKDDFCFTNYCARDTKKCDNGDNPLLEPRPSAGNQDRAGKKDVKFGIVRCDDTTVEMAENKEAVNQALVGKNYYRYVADLTIAYCMRMFGSYVPPYPVLQGLFHIDRTKDQACASYQFKAYIAGIPLAMGKPKSLFGECTGMKMTNTTVCEQASCSPGPLITGNLSELFSALAGGAYINVGGAAPGCVPLEGTPVGELIDKLTVLKTQTVGPIPLAVQFGPTLDICIDPLVGVGDEGVPKVTIRPSIGLGIDARGGIGLAEGQGKSKAIKFWAGIQLLLDIVKLGFPIGWGVDVADIPGYVAMWKIQVSQRIGIDLEMFSGSFSLFAELALGPFSIGYRLQLFNWTGLLFEWELSKVPLWSTKLDHEKAAITYGNMSNHNHGAWFGGKKCEGLCGK